MEETKLLMNIGSGVYITSVCGCVPAHDATGTAFKYLDCVRCR